MDFGQAIASCFRKYATFRGRAPRSEYWFFILFMFLVYFATGILDNVLMGGQTAEKGSPLTAIAWLAFFLPSLAVYVRRVHDTGWSGWIVGGFYLYFIFVMIVVGVMYAMDQEHHYNSDAMGGILILLMLTIFAYGLFLFVLSVLKGHDGPNRYGPDPFGSGDAEVFR